MYNLQEAFKKLNLLDEDVFDVSSADSESELSDYLMSDYELADTAEVIDDTAETEEELKDDYLGQVIVECPVCKSLIYKNPDEIIYDEADETLVNVGDECPYCFSSEGYHVIGEVTPYDEEESDKLMSGEEVEADIEDDMLGTDDSLEDDELEEGWLAQAYEKSGKSKSAKMPKVAESCGRKQNIKESLRIYTDLTEYNPWSGAVSTWDTIFNANMIDDLENMLEELYPDGMSVTELNDLLWFDSDFVLENLGLAEEDDELDESFDYVEVESDGRKLSMNSDENGGIHIDEVPVEFSNEDGTNAMYDEMEDETMPEEAEEEVDGMISPIQDDTEELVDLENTDFEEPEGDVGEEVPEEVETDIEYFDNEGFNELGESYLRNVYENVKSFKTKSCATDDHKLIIEGLITFKSGHTKPTRFVFKPEAITKTGKVKFLGENLNITKGHKAFTLGGKLKKGRLVCESLNYRYQTKDTQGKTKRLYDTVRLHK